MGIERDSGLYLNDFGLPESQNSHIVKLQEGRRLVSISIPFGRLPVTPGAGKGKKMPGPLKVSSSLGQALWEIVKEKNKQITISHFFPLPTG